MLIMFQLKSSNVDKDNDNIFFFSTSADLQIITATPTATGATVTIETDTVSGASPYIFNISMRSVWGMNGMHADGSQSNRIP